MMADADDSILHAVTAPAAGAAGAGLAPLPEGLLCPRCGYDLRLLTSAHCPECGLALDFIRAAEPQIAWVHRRQRGWLRAYWQTVWAISRNYRQFCVEIVRPVRYRDAQLFRWITILHAWGPLAIGTALVRLVARPKLESGLDWLPWLTVPIIGLLLLAALTGIASYGFHPRHLSIPTQNRAVALSYYAWGPVAFAPLCLLFFAPGVLLWRLDSDWVLGLILLGVAVYPCTLLLALLDVGRCRRRMVGSTWRGWLFRSALTVGVMLLFILVGLAMLYVALIIDSLRRA